MDLDWYSSVHGPGDKEEACFWMGKERRRRGESKGFSEKVSKR